MVRQAASRRAAMLGVLTVALIGLAPTRAVAGPSDTCQLLARVIPADAQITQDTSGTGESGDHCLAVVTYQDGLYEMVLDRLDDPSAGYEASIYVRGRASGQVEFTVPGLGERSRAFEEVNDTRSTDIVATWQRQCFAVQVDGDTELGATHDGTVALATNMDRVLDQRPRVCPNLGATPSTSSTSTTTTLPGGRPLCVEARVLLEGFSVDTLAAAGITDPLHTSIIRDDETLLPDLKKAIADWDRVAPGARSYAKDQLEAVTNILWVTGAKEFLPVNGTRAFRRSFITGQEQNLVDTIRNAVQTRRGRGDTRALTPGDVFALSIELHEGDVTEALLTAHNAMRGLAGEGDVGVRDGVGEEFFDDELAPVRGSNNAGALAQLYGAAYLEMSVQGSWGSTVSEFFATLLSDAPVFFELISDDIVYDKTKEAIEDQIKESAGGSSLTSRVTNGLARYIRQLQGKPFDPERFCFGVWGAQLGKELYESLPYAGTRTLSDPPFSDLGLPEGDDLPPLGDVLLDTQSVNVMHSPFSIRWSGPSGEMLFDQGASVDDDARLRGDAPPVFVPFLDDTTWGATWFGVEAPGDSITFEAMSPGATLHFHRFNLATGSVAYYESTAANPGERFTLTPGETADVPRLTAPDGSDVVPIVFNLTAESAGTPNISTDDDDGSSPAPFIGIGVALILAGGIGAWWWQRRRRAASTSA